MVTLMFLCKQEHECKRSQPTDEHGGNQHKAAYVVQLRRNAIGHSHRAQRRRRFEEYGKKAKWLEVSEQPTHGYEQQRSQRDNGE